jgi:serine/threonine protein kinase
MLAPALLNRPSTVSRRAERLLGTRVSGRRRASVDLDPRTLRQIGRYRIRRLVGEGHLALVFEAEDPGLFGARYALKLCKPGVADIGRFRQEARILAGIRHPNLISLHDFGRDEATGLQFYTADFIEGGSLAQVRPSWLVEREPTRIGGPVLSLPQVCRCTDDALSALAALHAGHVIHRDVKPASILLTPDGIAILCEIGIALHPEDPTPAPGERALGTVRYMAPEQILKRPLTPSSDLFAMGLTLYRVLAGESVYRSVAGVDLRSPQSISSHLTQLANEGGELEFTAPAGVPERIGAVIREAVRIRPQDRFRDAQTMRAALHAALNERAAPSRTDRRLAAIIKADVVAYSRLMAEDEERTVREIGACERLIRDLASEHGGRVVDFSGDNFLAEFTTTVAAAEYALEIQRTDTPEQRVRWRIGLHVGDVRVEGERIFGSGINVAARLEPLAETGGICVSSVVREQLRGTLDLDYEDMGEQRLKNLPDPVRAYRVRVQAGSPLSASHRSTT